jgi:DNA-binding NarL/FixJ family response regulator
MITTLIVEDNASFRQSLVDLLRHRFPSMAIAEAADGIEALQKVRLLAPDLIFMDIRLPGENGLELTKKLKREYPKIIIIVLTSYDLPEYREAASHLGANYFFSKGSSSREEILTVVQSIALDFGSQADRPQ